MIKVTITGLKEIIAGLQLRMGKMSQFTKALTAVGNNEIALAKQRIAVSKMSPEGTAWTPWSEATRIGREREGSAENGLLYRTGSLYNSFQIEINSNQLIVKNVAPYAMMLQQGTQNMPARPYFGWSDQSKTKIITVFEDFLGKTIIEGKDYNP